jgi:hypothetical protein
MATAVAQAQADAVRTSQGYLTAFLTLELSQRARGPAIDSRSYAGFGADGSTLTESLQSPLIGVYAASEGG